MRRSRPWRTISVASKIHTVLLLLVLSLVLASAMVACDSLDSESVSTTVTAGPGETESTAETQTGAGRISPENILFRDDFQDGDSDGWQIEQSWVVQQDGDLYTFDTAGEGYAYVPAGVAWEGDYAFRLTYLLRTGTLAFSFDATREGRYYVAVGDGHISLVKQDASGDKTVLTQAEAPEIGVAHYLVIAKQAGLIQVYVDRTLWLSSDDQSPLTSGTVIVGSIEGTDAWVDNVLVNKVLVTLPPNSPAVAPIDPSQVVDPAAGDIDISELPESGQDAPDLPDANLPEVIPEPTVAFGAYLQPDGEAPGTDELVVPEGSLYVLEWSVQDATGHFLDGAACLQAGSQIMSATEDTEHGLEVVGWDGLPYTYSVSITIGGGGDVVLAGPDLSISVTVTPQGGRDVTVSIEVSNSGTASAQNATVYWYAHEQSGASDLVETVSVPAGASRAMSIDYTYGARGTMHWGARVTTDPLDADTDQGNNYVSGTVTVGQ